MNKKKKKRKILAKNIPFHCRPLLIIFSIRYAPMRLPVAVVSLDYPLSPTEYTRVVGFTWERGFQADPRLGEKRFGDVSRPGSLSRFKKMRRKLRPPLSSASSPSVSVPSLRLLSNTSVYPTLAALFAILFNKSLRRARDLLSPSASSAHTDAHIHTHLGEIAHVRTHAQTHAYPG